MEELTYRERAEKGLAWILENSGRFGLDINRISAAEKINWINIASGIRCPLGQVGGTHYAQVYRDIKSAYGFTSVQGMEWAYEHGFDTSWVVHPTDSYRELSNAWREVLLEHFNLLELADA